MADLLRTGATKLIEQAVEASAAMSTYAEDRAATVRNGYLPEREVTAGVAPISVKVSKLRQRCWVHYADLPILSTPGRQSVRRAAPEAMVSA